MNKLKEWFFLAVIITVGLLAFFMGRRVNFKEIFKRQDAEQNAHKKSIDRIKSDLKEPPKTPKLSSEGVKEYWDEIFNRTNN